MMTSKHILLGMLLSLCGGIPGKARGQTLSGRCGTSWSEFFPSGSANTNAQCQDWRNFRNSISGEYSSIRISGTFDTAGVTCSNPSIVNQIAAGLRNGSSFSISCDGRVWSMCDRYNGEVWIGPPSLCSGSNCPNPGYIVRPCIGNSNVGGVNTRTCSHPSQTMQIDICRQNEQTFNSVSTTRSTTIAPSCNGNLHSWSDFFSQGSGSTSGQCQKWKNFLSGITGNYNSIRLSGSYDTQGVVCNDPEKAGSIARAMASGSSFSISCGGNLWSYCSRYSGELWIGPPSLCSGSNCPNPGYIVRPCIGTGNSNIGGVNTATCGHPSQTMRIDLCGGNSNNVVTTRSSSTQSIGGSGNSVCYAGSSSVLRMTEACSDPKPATITSSGYFTFYANKGEKKRTCGSFSKGGSTGQNAVWSQNRFDLRGGARIQWSSNGGGGSFSCCYYPTIFREYDLIASPTTGNATGQCCFSTSYSYGGSTVLTANVPYCSEWRFNPELTIAYMTTYKSSCDNINGNTEKVGDHYATLTDKMRNELRSTEVGLAFGDAYRRQQASATFEKLCLLGNSHSVGGHDVTTETTPPNYHTATHSHHGWTGTYPPDYHTGTRSHSPGWGEWTDATFESSSTSSSSSLMNEQNSFGDNNEDPFFNANRFQTTRKTHYGTGSGSDAEKQTLGRGEIIIIVGVLISIIVISGVVLVVYLKGGLSSGNGTESTKNAFANPVYDADLPPTPAFDGGYMETDAAVEAEEEFHGFN